MLDGVSAGLKLSGRWTDQALANALTELIGRNIHTPPTPLEVGGKVLPFQTRSPP
jgi:hypothetical protein